MHEAPDAGDAQVSVVAGALAYADDRLDDARREWESAFAALRAASETRAAARVAAELAQLHASALGNTAAGSGWLARARRVLEGEGPCVEHGYVELAFIACDRPDVDELLQSAERALALALEFRDPDLEVRALADSGLALVTQGHVAEGFARLDEALAAIAAGEATDPAVVGKSLCSLLSACDRAGDVRRAEEWTRLVHELVLDRLDGRPRVLQTHCVAAYGSVLSGAGRWPEAEAAMLEVLGPASSKSYGHRADTAANLAALRVEQGRVEEAAELLAPFEDRVTACAPAARVHLAQNEPALAAAVLRRGLKEMVGDALRGSTLLALLVESELQQGDVAAARAAAQQLDELAGSTGIDLLRAEAAIARGRVDAATDDLDAAADAFEEAKRRVPVDDRPLTAAVASLELASVLSRAGRTADAVAEARAALATFERLGALAGRDRTLALLRGLGAGDRARHQPPAALVATLTARESEVLELIRQGLSNADIGARLYISPKTAEHHVGRILTKLAVRNRAEAAAAATAAARSATGN